MSPVKEEKRMKNEGSTGSEQQDSCSNISRQDDDGGEMSRQEQAMLDLERDLALREWRLNKEEEEKEKNKEKEEKRRLKEDREKRKSCIDKGRHVDSTL